MIAKHLRFQGWSSLTRDETDVFREGHAHPAAGTPGPPSFWLPWVYARKWFVWMLMLSVLLMMRDGRCREARAQGPIQDDVVKQPANASTLPANLMGRPPAPDLAKFLERSVLGETAVMEEVQDQLKSVAEVRIRLLDQAVHLSPIQRKKLELAALGEIRRFISRFEQEREEFQSSSDPAMVDSPEFAQRVEKIRTEYANLQLLEGVTFFDKSLKSVLEPGQLQVYEEAAVKAEELQTHMVVLRHYVFWVDQTVGLNSAQRTQLKDILSKESKAVPTRFLSVFVPSRTMAIMALLPEDRLRPIFFDEQWEPLEARILRATAELYARQRHPEPLGRPILPSDKLSREELLKYSRPAPVKPVPDVRLLRPLLEQEYRFLRAACRPTLAQRVDIARAGLLALDRAAEVLMDWRIQFRSVRGNPPEVPDLRALIREDLRKDLKACLTEDQWRTFEREASARDQEERLASIEEFVVFLGYSLELSKLQRSWLLESLASHWDETWGRGLRAPSLAYPNPNLPKVPDLLVVPILTVAQKKRWIGLPRGDLYAALLHTLHVMDLAPNETRDLDKDFPDPTSARSNLTVP